MPDQPAITLRPATGADESFLLDVYASTREIELSQTNWPAEHKAQFCAMQGRAQHEHYRQHYPTAQYFIIECDQAPAGRLYVDHWEKEIRIMDIALLPSYRQRGIGSHLLADLQKQARSAAKMLSIHVESFNPALRLYQRLGFAISEDKGVYQFMTWTPETAIK